MALSAVNGVRGTWVLFASIMELRDLKDDRLLY